MKYPGRLLLAAIAAWATLVYLPAAGTLVSAETTAALAAFESAQRQSLLQASVEPMARFLGDEVHLMPEFQRTVLGRDNTFFYYCALVARFSFQAYERELIGVIGLGEAPRFYADDAVLLPNFNVAWVGRQAIDAYVARHFPKRPVCEKLDIRCDRIDELDGYLIEYASHVANWRGGEYSGVSSGKNLHIWRRQSDHALKIIAQLGTYD